MLVSSHVLLSSRVAPVGVGCGVEQSNIPRMRSGCKIMITSLGILGKKKLAPEPSRRHWRVPGASLWRYISARSRRPPAGSGSNRRDDAFRRFDDLAGVKAQILAKARRQNMHAGSAEGHDGHRHGAQEVPAPAKLARPGSSPTQVALRRGMRPNEPRRPMTPLYKPGIRTEHPDVDLRDRSDHDDTAESAAARLPLPAASTISRLHFAR